MNTKHRIRVVAAGLLLVIAALTALPVTSGALPIKWRDPYNAAGDPDIPVNGTIVKRAPELGLSVVWTGSALPMLLPTVVRKTSFGFATKQLNRNRR